MKKTKKLLVLFLALMMALSCMAVPAMAHGDEGIMPRVRVTICSCGASASLYTSEEPGAKMKVLGCSDIPSRSHYHEKIIVTKTIICEKGHICSSDSATQLTFCLG